MRYINIKALFSKSSVITYILLLLLFVLFSITPSQACPTLAQEAVLPNRPHFEKGKTIYYTFDNNK